MLAADSVGDPIAELRDDAAGLGYRDEAVWSDRGAVARREAQQRLGRHRQGGRDIDHGLVVQTQALVRETLLDLRFNTMRLIGAAPQLWREHAVAGTPAFLGAIHRQVGPVQQDVNLGAMLWIEADAHRCRYRQLEAIEAKGAAQRLDDMTRYRGCAVTPAEIGQHDHELVTTKAADQILVPDAGFYPLRDFMQQAVTNLMSVEIIDRLEAVKINEQQCAPAVPAAGSGEQVTGVLEDERAVR